MIKRKKNRRNPKLKYEVQEILDRFYPDYDDIEVKYISGGTYGEAYKLTLTSKKSLDNHFLLPGDYVLKLYKTSTDDELTMDPRWYKDFYQPLNIKAIDKLTLLSKYGLIPKIFVINKYFIIMKYISAKTLNQLVEDNLTINRFDMIMKKVYELANKWKKLGFVHNDLNGGNILVTNSNRVFFIDPDTSFKAKNNRDLQYLEEMDEEIGKELEFREESNLIKDKFYNF